MKRNKKNYLCAVFHNNASSIIAHTALWRHYEDCEEWGRELLVADLRYLVAAAAFLGITTENVKDEMKSIVKGF